jgi:hypothetical protein
MLGLWVLGISVAVTLAGCASLGANTGAGGAAPPDVSADTTRAIQEFESRRKADALEGQSWLGPARRPDLDHDVTQGKQSRGLNRATGR